MLKVITVTNNLDATKPLLDSLCKNHWDCVIIDMPWRGFGTKLIETYQYLKENPEVTEFVFCDAFDVICLGTPEEFLSKLIEPDKMLLSAEKGCWPPSMQQYEVYYEPIETGFFNYVNSGLYYSPAKIFIEIMERNMPQYESDDQEWMGLNFLFNDEVEIRLDRNQVLFNSHSFIADGEYGYENNRIQILGNQPVFIHSNGRTVDEKLNAILK